MGHTSVFLVFFFWPAIRIIVKVADQAQYSMEDSKLKSKLMKYENKKKIEKNQTLKGRKNLESFNKRNVLHRKLQCLEKENQWNRRRLLSKLKLIKPVPEHVLLMVVSEMIRLILKLKFEVFDIRVFTQQRKEKNASSTQLLCHILNIFFRRKCCWYPKTSFPDKDRAGK